MTDYHKQIRQRMASEPSFESAEDAEDMLERLLRRTPGEIRRADYQGFFDTPNVFVDFLLPSTHPLTIGRDIFTSSFTVRASDGRIGEMSIRFPAIAVTDVDGDELQAFMETIAPETYRIRVQLQDEVDGPEPEYHPHVHYSSKRRGSKGPPISDELPKLNRMIRRWYADVGSIL